VDEFSEEELSEPVEPVVHRHISWGAIVGAGFGLALGAMWVHYGFWTALGAAFLAVVGGLLGRYYVGD
jgi:hypothetical protein